MDIIKLFTLSWRGWGFPGNTAAGPPCRWGSASRSVGAKRAVAAGGPGGCPGAAGKRAPR